MWKTPALNVPVSLRPREHQNTHTACNKANGYPLSCGHKMHMHAWSQKQSTQIEQIDPNYVEKDTQIGG